jgi:hypothetical protein
MTRNLLPLYTFFRALGFHPFHAFGVAGTGDLAVQTGCDTLVRRYEWQNSDAAGHRAIEQAIASAEAKLTAYLGYSPAPHYVVESLPWPVRADSLLASGPWQADGRRLSVQLTEGEIRAVGVETLSSIATANVSYSDADGDGVEDTFTVTAATTVTNVSEIAVYFSSGDRFSAWDDLATLSSRWRIQPVRVSISGGVVTVRGPKVLLVKPLKYEGNTNIGPNGLDPSTGSTDFVTTLDLYRRYTATDGQTVSTSQAVLTWETRPSHGWWCCCGCQDAASAYGSPYDPAAVAQAVARVGIRDGTLGLVTPAEAAYDATAGTWSDLDWSVCDVPDRVTVRYLAGYPLDASGQMQEPFRTAVVRMAAAELARPVCGCDDANRELARWQFDVARSTGANDESYSITEADLANPFGTRRGHITAYKLVRQLRQLRGILA